MKNIYLLCKLRWIFYLSKVHCTCFVSLLFIEFSDMVVHVYHKMRFKITCKVKFTNKCYILPVFAENELCSSAERSVSLVSQDYFPTTAIQAIAKAYVVLLQSGTITTEFLLTKCL